MSNNIREIIERALVQLKSSKNLLVKEQWLKHAKYQMRPANRANKKSIFNQGKLNKLHTDLC